MIKPDKPIAVLVLGEHIFVSDNGSSASAEVYASAKRHGFEGGDFFIIDSSCGFGTLDEALDSRGATGTIIDATITDKQNE